MESYLDNRLARLYHRNMDNDMDSSNSIMSELLDGRPANGEDESPFFTVLEAAKYARCSKRTIRRRIAVGKLVAHGDAHRLLVRREEVRALFGRALAPTAQS